MSTIVTKDVAAGAVADISALRMEINADATVAATCNGVMLTPDVGTDHLRFDFDAVPNDAALDAVIAATPVTVPEIPSSLAVVARTWTDIVSFAVAEGTAAIFEIRLCGSIGAPADIKAIDLSASGTCERPDGGSLVVDIPFSSATNPRLRLRADVSGTIVTLQVRPTIAGTITFASRSSFEVMSVGAPP